MEYPPRACVLLSPSALLMTAPAPAHTHTHTCRAMQGSGCVCVCVTDATAASGRLIRCVWVCVSPTLPWREHSTTGWPAKRTPTNTRVHDTACGVIDIHG